MNNLFAVDTNILASAFLFKHSKPRRSFDMATERGKVAASIETYDKFRDVFLRPKSNKYIPLKIRSRVIKELKELSLFLEITETITACRDPKNNKFLELAVAANASCVVNGDNDLLTLHPFRGISIFKRF